MVKSNGFSTHSNYRTPSRKAVGMAPGVTIEPFNSWFKLLFDQNDRTWHRGLDNNRRQILAAIFISRLLLRMNWKRGKRNGQIKWILDAL